MSAENIERFSVPHPRKTSRSLLILGGRSRRTSRAGPSLGVREGLLGAGWTGPDDLALARRLAAVP